MKFRKEYIVANNERLALFENKVFKELLGPGVHKFWDIKNELAVQLLSVDESEAELTEEWLQLLNSTPELEKEVQVVEVAEQEVAIIRAYKEILRIVTPSERTALWKFVPGIKVEVIDISDSLEINNDLLKQFVNQNILANKSITSAVIGQNMQGLLYVDGKFERLLSTGRYAFWAYNRDVQIKLQSFKLQTLEVNGQEILSKDRVSLRLNLQAMFKVEDAELAMHKAENVNDYLYRRMQLSLREEVGTRSLDQLLEAKDQISKTIFSKTKDDFKALGIELIQVGVKDIILPGEMKNILNQVVQAQKQAEANVIKRREETAATRSLLNTAKVIEGNPTLMRLKEMEAQEKVAEKIDRITVVGAVSDVMDSLLRAERRA